MTATTFSLPARQALDSNCVHRVRAVRLDNAGDAYRAVDRGDQLVTVGPWLVGVVVAMRLQTNRCHVADGTPAGRTPTGAGQPALVIATDEPLADAPGTSVAPPGVASAGIVSATGIGTGGFTFITITGPVVPAGSYFLRSVQFLFSPLGAPPRTGIVQWFPQPATPPLITTRLDATQSAVVSPSIAIPFSAPGGAGWQAMFTPDDGGLINVGERFTVFAQFDAQPG